MFYMINIHFTNVKQLSYTRNNSSASQYELEIKQNNKMVCNRKCAYHQYCLFWERWKCFFRIFV